MWNTHLRYPRSFGRSLLLACRPDSGLLSLLAGSSLLSLLVVAGLVSNWSSSSPSESVSLWAARSLRGLDSVVCRCAGWCRSMVVCRDEGDVTEESVEDVLRCEDVFVEDCDIDEAVLPSCLEWPMTLVSLEWRYSLGRWLCFGSRLSLSELSESSSSFPRRLSRVMLGDESSCTCAINGPRSYDLSVDAGRVCLA